MSQNSVMTPVLLGAAAGTVVAIGLGLLLKIVIDQQVTQTIDREVPPKLRAELDRKLSEVGLTPERSRQIAAFVGTLDQAGIFGTMSRTGQAAAARPS